MAASNAVVAPTNWITAIFSTFSTINWGEIGATIEAKSLGGAVTTAEHVAEAVAGAFAATGNPIALTAEAVIPAAESMIGVALNLVAAFHHAGAATPAAAAPIPAPPGKAVS